LSKSYCPLKGTNSLANFFFWNTIEPKIVQVAFPNLDLDNYQTQLKAAAYHIRFYEAPRWSIGVARRSLPPHHELETRPRDLSEIAIPNDCSEPSTYTWLQEETNHFYSKISDSLREEVVADNHQVFKNRFNEAFCQDINNILLWFSGKDLLAALNTWCVENGFQYPGDFRAELGKLCRYEPEEVRNLLPEWQALRRFFRP
jgi:hypothetical protein